MNEFQSTQSDKQNLSFSTIQSVLSLLPDSRTENLGAQIWQKLGSN